MAVFFRFNKGLNFMKTNRQNLDFLHIKIVTVIRRFKIKRSDGESPFMLKKYFEVISQFSTGCTLDIFKIDSIDKKILIAYQISVLASFRSFLRFRPERFKCLLKSIENKITNL